MILISALGVGEPLYRKGSGIPDDPALRQRQIDVPGMRPSRSWYLGFREPPGEEAHWSLPQTSTPLT
jgi:hypothetical protein